MSTYLIAGAAGFVGTNYVHHVLREAPDATIVAVDYLGPGSCLSSLGESLDAVSFVEADIADTARLLEIYEDYRPDLVVNLAAESHHERAILAPTAAVRSNTVGAQSMLECSRTMGVARHLHVSTVEVYGTLPPDIEAFNEHSPLNARTPYGASKAAGDQLVRAYMYTYRDMDIRLTHCTNNYGPYQTLEKLVPLVVTNVLRGQQVPLHGDGLQERDWLHVSDHCRGIHAVLHDPRIGRSTGLEHLPIFEIAARNRVTNLQLVHSVIELLDEDPDGWILHVPDRNSHDRRRSLDPSRIEAELSWSPSMEFAEGLTATVAWYVQHHLWWEPLVIGGARVGLERESPERSARV